jgi:acetolactate synthase-1/2/3 large subunit
LQDYGQGEGVRPDALLRRVDQLTQGQPLAVTSGVGSHQQWVARYFTFDLPTRQLFASAGHGTMGYGLPTAIGLQRLLPGQLVVAVDGDGSFQMNLQELMLLRELQLPVKILLLDNQRLGIVSQFQQLTFKADPVTGDYPSPDFGAIARAYGVQAWEMRRLDDGLIRQWLASEGPALLHVHVQHDAPVSPMLMGGQAPGEMWYQYPWEKADD